MLTRLAAALLLLVLAAAGARAREVSRLSARGLLGAGGGLVSTAFGVALVAAAALVLAGLVAALVRRARRRDDDLVPIIERPGTWWQRALALLAALALAGLLLAAVLAAVRAGRASQRAGQPPAPALPALPHLPGSTPPGGVSGIAFLLAATAGLTAAAAAWLWLRRPRRMTAELAVPPQDAPPPLAAAVAAGSTALAAGATARDAIISCYAAMEQSLAVAGAPRRAADTPEELLRRAVGAGVLRTPAAGRLTTLFREARFSPHPLGPAQRDAARTALDEIARDLAGQR